MPDLDQMLSDGMLYVCCNNILYFVTGILIGALNNRFGSKTIAMIGCFMISLGLLLSSLLINIPYLYVTYGVIAGN